MKASDHKWEQIDKFTDRMKVPGGWIYRYISSRFSTDAGVAMVFVPE